MNEAMLVAALFAVDPIGTGGIVLRGWPGPARDRWFAGFQALLPAATPIRRVPLHVSEERLLGGLDLTATLQTGKPVMQRGLMAEADDGLLVLPQAERIAAPMMAEIVAALDSGAVRLERDGLAERLPARFGVIALDEGMEEEERPAAALTDRLAFSIELSGNPGDPDVDSDHIAAARGRLTAVTVPEAVIDGICQTAMALGVASLRPAILALAGARALAALAGRSEIASEDAATAVRLVLAPRATMLPAAEPDSDPPPAEAESETPQPEQPSSSDAVAAETEPVEVEIPLAEMMVAAAAAAIPPGVLEKLKMEQGKAGGARKGGKAGALQVSRRRGRPAGVRRGAPGRGARLNIIETLRAAAPWQRLRRAADGERRVAIRRDDFRIQRMIERRETTTIFVVDASGSLALTRLAEAKGAVELLLAECYIRRDRVALIAFRGRQSELLLPPTRSLVRAKRSLASLPGGGGTPLAAALDAAAALADHVRRDGQTPVIVLMTDGRANVARDGTTGRGPAEADTMAAARSLRGARLTSVLIDTSAHIQPAAARIAAEMGATYLPLPHADAAILAKSVRAATEPVSCRS